MNVTQLSTEIGELKSKVAELEQALREIGLCRTCHRAHERGVVRCVYQNVSMRSDV